MPKFDFNAASTLVDEPLPTIKGRGQPHVHDEYDEAVEQMIETGWTHKVVLPKGSEADTKALVTLLTNRMQAAAKRAGKGISTRRNGQTLMFATKDRRPFTPRPVKATNGSTPA